VPRIHVLPSPVIDRIAAGEVVGVVGDNGAGKSTLIKIMTGVYQPDRGEILLSGQPIAIGSAAEALQRLQERFKLAVITNCDEDLFAQSERRLGVSFDYVITAQQAGSYKPDHANFLLAFERIDEPRERILHVAQSLFHDHLPAKELGMTSVWIDRRQGRGGGASRDVEAHPDATFPSMEAFAAEAVPA